MSLGIVSPSQILRADEQQMCLLRLFVDGEKCS